MSSHDSTGARAWLRLLVAIAAFGFVCGWGLPPAAFGDGTIVAPRDYKGSLEEQAQEAIIIFHSSEKAGGATEDLILKIRVQGSAKSFAWIIPFPNEPKIAKEDPKLFTELFSYVEARTVRRHKGKGDGMKSAGEASPAAKPPVEVLARKIVGSYDTAVVRENVAGALNKWLDAEGFQTLPDAEDVIGFYRKKGYVFACIKVSDAELDKDRLVDSHPLRFSFKTGGRDGIFYPMKMTGLQSAPFTVNLYVFYGAWINDRLSKFGYTHRGFRLRYRDWDSPRCKANAGKTWSSPETDPFLASMAHRVPTLKKLFQKLHPGERYYLTNIQAHGLRPAEVRQWADDLWVFPYYIDRRFVPYDARPGGPASAAWPHEADAAPAGGDTRGSAASASSTRKAVGYGSLGLLVLGATVLGLWGLRRRAR